MSIAYDVTPAEGVESEIVIRPKGTDSVLRARVRGEHVAVQWVRPNGKTWHQPLHLGRKDAPYLLRALAEWVEGQEE